MSGSGASFRADLASGSRGSRRNRPQHGVALPHVRSRARHGSCSLSPSSRSCRRPTPQPPPSPRSRRTCAPPRSTTTSRRRSRLRSGGRSTRRSRAPPRPSASCAWPCSRRRPRTRPRDTAAPRLRSRLKLNGTVIVALPASVQVASLNVSGARLAQVRAAVAGKGGPAGARLAINALLAPPKKPVDHDHDRRTTTTTATTPVEVEVERPRNLDLHRDRGRRRRDRAVLTALRARTRKVRRRGGGSLIAGARALLQGRLEGLGEGLAATAVGVSEREDRALTEHHREAADIVSDVRASIGRLDGPPAFRNAHAQLDEAEWHLGVVQAHLDGLRRAAAPRGRATRHAASSTRTTASARSRSSSRCPACAPSRSASARPTPSASRAATSPRSARSAVGRRSLPWAAAPTWYGGWGWGQDDLPGAALPRRSRSSRRARSSTRSADSVSSPRSITVRPAPSEPRAERPSRSGRAARRSRPPSRASSRTRAARAGRRGRLRSRRRGARRPERRESSRARPRRHAGENDEPRSADEPSPTAGDLARRVPPTRDLRDLLNVQRALPILRLGELTSTTCTSAMELRATHHPHHPVTGSRREPIQGGSMSLRVNTNIEAMDAHRNLEQTQYALSKSMQKLSSGLRINSAADDAAGARDLREDDLAGQRHRPGAAQHDGRHLARPDR